MATQLMTTHERICRMFAHQEADRIPVTDVPWAATLERWQAEGMPREVEYLDFFDLDRFRLFAVDTSPRYPERTLEDTDDYLIATTPWGVTTKQWKHAASTPEFLDFTVVDPKSWRTAKERMTPSPDRIPWENLGREYPKWRREGAWIQAGLSFGFDMTHSWIVGMERILVALIEDPEWCVDMFTHELDVQLALLEMVWEAGYHFDSLFWCDDMGYKYNQFFSVHTYRELLKPVHQRAIQWAHAKGIKAHLHSCGDITPCVPELIEIGVDALNPLEVKAGMDPLQLKQQYGDRLVFHGGIDALLYQDMAAMEAEMRRMIPAMKATGGFICSTDHSVPSSVSLEDFSRFVSLAKELGAFT